MMGQQPSAPGNATRRLSVVPFEGPDAEWDRFVVESRDGSFCHLAAWRDIMENVLGHECLFSVAVDDEGAWRGVLPLVRVKSRLFGHFLVSMPFLNYGGPIGDPEARAELASFAVTEARGSGAGLLELRTRNELDAGLTVSRRKITVVLPLPDDPDTLFQDTFNSKLRSQIRRPLRDGMEARFGDAERDSFYEVFSSHMRDLGTPVLARDFFQRICTDLVPHVTFGAVYWRERPVAAGCGFVWGDEFEMTWASALLEYKHAAPNMLLYWSFMKEMIARGIKVFNFGRCSPGGGTHRFKRQWGGEDVSLPWGQWSPRGISATPSPDRPVYRLGGSVWRRVPKPIANRLGPSLARHLP